MGLGSFTMRTKQALSPSNNGSKDYDTHREEGCVQGCNPLLLGPRTAMWGRGQECNPLLKGDIPLINVALRDIPLADSYKRVWDFWALGVEWK